MVKYRNIRTGVVADDAKEGSDYVCHNKLCQDCPLYDYVHEHNFICTDELAEEAFAKLYEVCGFELVNDADEVEPNPESPISRLAEVLGVEEDQEWTVVDNPDVFYRIHEGERQWRTQTSRKWNSCCQEITLTKLINNPDFIQPVFKPQWTEREIEIVKAWKTMNPSMTHFIINVFNDTEIEIDCIPLTEDPEKCHNFFACKNKEIEVSDILGES